MAAKYLFLPVRVGTFEQDGLDDRSKQLLIGPDVRLVPAQRVRHHGA